MTITEIKNTYLNKDITDREPYYRLDIGEKRYYYSMVDGDFKIYPSWTTVLSATMPTPTHLIKWYADLGYDEAQEYMRERANYGTLLHILISKFLQDGSLPIEDDKIYNEIMKYENLTSRYNQYWIQDLQNDVLAFAQFCNDVNLQPIGTEITLVSKTHEVAGTLDLIAEIDFGNKREVVLIDMKSGRKGFYDQHILQLAGYRDTWNDNHPELPVNLIFNWSPKDWSKTPTYHFTNQTNQELISTLPHLVSLFKLTNSPKKTVFEATGEIRLGIDVAENYRKVDIIDIIKEKYGIKEPKRRVSTKYLPDLQPIDDNF